MNKFITLTALVLLASCAAQPETTGAAVSNETSTQRGILWTDGHGPVNVSVAGDARCNALSASETEAALRQTNAVRSAAGLPLLQTNARLQKAAQQQACDMAGRGVMEHRGSRSAGPGMRVKQLGYKPRITAENIAAGSASLFDLNGALREWSSSGRHRANIVIPQMREMGIGRALSADGRHAYWSAVYAAPK